jgi:hypothetical protein
MCGQRLGAAKEGVLKFGKWRRRKETIIAKGKQILIEIHKCVITVLSINVLVLENVHEMIF